ncbi:CoA-acylating methylmalonate-semialdehyde dehydrogenase [Halobacillus sp. A5]|uniref:CoA-acylating methylmalonate-semialdehyde dehydrogenase n=1 Tax=Halobacillus sp. A5 TaxID=2880263 RepID=UPI0020A6900D|nr:CoA-acylating methylmalonate-semialdehyde dehydrogenase [Halobacillus sp. A5]MCP3026579.1 CoA-acylating methylmalonate-semialdehyde dehydrogenase [Halobacillus sp. A5]
METTFSKSNQMMIQNFINGEWVTSKGEQFEEVPNPATGEIIAKVPISSKEDVDHAVRSAREAFKTWSKTPVTKRVRVLFEYQQKLKEHHEELAKVITQENGKTKKDAMGEVQRGIECVEFAAGAPSLMMGEMLPDIADGIDSGMYRYPLGVVGGITPFNFPMMVPLWMFPLAIACGNTFVLKPSERTPILAKFLVELMQESGLPKGVLNLVNGAHDVVNGLLEHEEVDAISFVGSQPVAEYIYKTAANHGKRVQALAGAKNHSIVMPDCHLDKSVEGIINAAFGSAGERCMACSVVVAVGDVGDQLVEKIKQAADELNVGDGLEETTSLGPLIRETHRDRVVNYIEQGEKENAKLVRDGRLELREHETGYFLGATIFDYVTEEMEIWKDEIFAPVLSIVRTDTLSEAIETANNSEFANGAVIYTSSGEAVRQFREEMDAGMLGVNVNVPAPMAFFPFSGAKKSFYGDLHANGKDGVNFYTRKKMLTQRWF